jgi:hypothetical protein
MQRLNTRSNLPGVRQTTGLSLALSRASGIKSKNQIDDGLLPAASKPFWRTPRLDKKQLGALGNNFRLGTLSATAIMKLAGAPALAQQQKPNVVVILADNVGYGD